MTTISDRTVLFADLRGSTALYESLGNAEATSVVTHCVNAIAAAVGACGGRVVKTRGDGLMAVFDAPAPALEAATEMHETLAALASRGSERGASSGLRALRLQVALARGETVEMSGDCYGDAVNVAARLLDHASDDETLITAEVLRDLPPEAAARFRSLDRLALRGRVEPVEVHATGGERVTSDPVATQFSGLAPDFDPDGLLLGWQRYSRSFTHQQMPVFLGRSPQATFFVDDSRVSRSHARIDWHGGAFQLTDLSYNGTYVRFADGEIVSLRRGSCMLHGSGDIGLGSAPNDPDAALVTFEVLHFSDTQTSAGVDAR
jgi:class 3 adenylate cyclase